MTGSTPSPSKSVKTHICLRLRSLQGIRVPSSVDASRVRASVRISHEGRLYGISGWSEKLIRNNPRSMSRKTSSSSARAIWYDKYNNEMEFDVPNEYYDERKQWLTLSVCLKLPSGTTLPIGSCEWDPSQMHSIQHLPIINPKQDNSTSTANTVGNAMLVLEADPPVVIRDDHDTIPNMVSCHGQQTLPATPNDESHNTAENPPPPTPSSTAVSTTTSSSILTSCHDTGDSVFDNLFPRSAPPIESPQAASTRSSFFGSSSFVTQDQDVEEKEEEEESSSHVERIGSHNTPAPTMMHSIPRDSQSPPTVTTTRWNRFTNPRHIPATTTKTTPLPSLAPPNHDTPSINNHHHPRKNFLQDRLLTKHWKNSAVLRRVRNVISPVRERPQDPSHERTVNSSSQPQGEEVSQTVFRRVRNVISPIRGGGRRSAQDNIRHSDPTHRFQRQEAPPPDPNAEDPRHRRHPGMGGVLRKVRNAISPPPNLRPNGETSQYWTDDSKFLRNAPAEHERGNIRRPHPTSILKRREIPDLHTQHSFLSDQTPKASGRGGTPQSPQPTRPTHVLHNLPRVPSSTLLSRGPPSSPTAKATASASHSQRTAVTETSSTGRSSSKSWHSSVRLRPPPQTPPRLHSKTSPASTPQSTPDRSGQSHATSGRRSMPLRSIEVERSGSPHDNDADSQVSSLVGSFAASMRRQQQLQRQDQWAIENLPVACGGGVTKSHSAWLAPLVTGHDDNVSLYTDDGGDTDSVSFAQPPPNPLCHDTYTLQEDWMPDQSPFFCHAEFLDYDTAHRCRGGKGDRYHLFAQNHGLEDDGDDGDSLDTAELSQAMASHTESRFQQRRVHGGENDSGVVASNVSETVASV